ncbi:MAG: rRNA maturation RNase YbeY [Candidatus Aquicultorales bacterium]
MNEELVRSLAERVLESEDVPEAAELSIAFVETEEMRRLNKTYRGIDDATDVLSFPMEKEAVPGGEPFLVGDVVIAPEIARIQAEEAGHSYDAEIGLLLVHGIFHLLGYDHQNPEEGEEMERKERELLEPFFGGVFES